MNKAKVTSLICGGMVSLAGTTLLGQTSATSPGQSSSSSLGQSSTGSSQSHDSSSSSTLGTTSSQYGMQAGQATRLSELMHAPVQAKDGKQLGHIRDFTVDPQTGRIEFAILSLDTAVGLTSGSTSTAPGTTGTSSSTTGSSSTSRSASDLSRNSSGLSSSATSGYGATGKLVPVPWQLFSESWSGTTSTTGRSSTTGSTIGGSTMAQPTLTLNVDESKLQSAPSFQAGNWNELEQSSFAQQVYSHFGVSRSSATGMPGSSVSGQGTSGYKSYGGSSPDSSTSHGTTTQPQK